MTFRLAASFCKRRQRTQIGTAPRLLLHAREGSSGFPRREDLRACVNQEFLPINQQRLKAGGAGGTKTRSRTCARHDLSWPRTHTCQLQHARPPASPCSPSCGAAGAASKSPLATGASVLPSGRVRVPGYNGRVRACFGVRAWTMPTRKECAEVAGGRREVWRMTE